MDKVTTKLQSNNLQPANLHPDKVLLDSSKKNVCILPGCEHIAGSKKFITKALALQQEMQGAFDITCDLEDGIAAGDAVNAVTVILEALHSPENQFKQIGVRLLPFRHPDWTTTVEQLLKEGGEQIAYLTLPKLNRYFELVYVASCIRTIGERTGLKRSIPLHVLVETRSILSELAQVAAYPGVQTLDFGIMDFVADHDGAIDISQIHSPAQFNHRLLASAKLKIVETALAAGIVPCHNVTINYADPEATYQDAKKAQSEFGFLRMWSIHPAQIEPIIRAMRPSTSELEQATEILIAAYQKNWAPIGFEGILYDRASYRSLWQKIKRANKNGMELPTQCQQLFFS